MLTSPTATALLTVPGFVLSLGAVLWNVRMGIREARAWRAQQQYEAARRREGAAP